MKHLETEEFVKVWESYATLDEIETAIADLCKKAGRVPMPREVIAAKACNLRASGWKLSKKQAGPKNKYDEAYKNEFIAKLLEMKARGELTNEEEPSPSN